MEKPADELRSNVELFLRTLGAEVKPERTVEHDRLRDRSDSGVGWRTASISDCRVGQVGSKLVDSHIREDMFFAEDIF